MIFKLVFKLEAKKEWDKLDHTIKTQLRKNLAKD